MDIHCVTTRLERYYSTTVSTGTKNLGIRNSQVPTVLIVAVLNKLPLKFAERLFFSGKF